MEVKIGVTHANRELTLDINVNVDDVQKKIEDALATDNGVVTLTDDRGRTVVVPVGKLAYVEFTGDTGRRVGFGPA